MGQGLTYVKNRMSIAAQKQKCRLWAENEGTKESRELKVVLLLGIAKKARKTANDQFDRENILKWN